MVRTLETIMVCLIDRRGERYWFICLRVVKGLVAGNVVLLFPHTCLNSGVTERTLESLLHDGTPIQERSPLQGLAAFRDISELHPLWGLHLVMMGTRTRRLPRCYHVCKLSHEGPTQAEAALARADAKEYHEVECVDLEAGYEYDHACNALGHAFSFAEIAIGSLEAMREDETKRDHEENCHQLVGEDVKPKCDPPSPATHLHTEAI